MTLERTNADLQALQAQIEEAEKYRDEIELAEFNANRAGAYTAEIELGVTAQAITYNLRVLRRRMRNCVEDVMNAWARNA